MMKSVRRFLRARGGASAVEFALVVPIFATMIFLMINLAMGLWAAAALHLAVDTMARCMAVQPTICDNVADTKAQHPYIGPGINPTFTVLGVTSCANELTGTGSFTVHAVLVSATIPLSSSACFPAQT